VRQLIPLSALGELLHHPQQAYMRLSPEQRKKLHVHNFEQEALVKTGPRSNGRYH
jgi:hypothetical protein